MKKNFVTKKFRPENNLRKKVIIGLKNQNKTSIQWTPESQMYLSSKKIIFGQKRYLSKKKHK